MKKLFIPFVLLAFLLMACSNDTADDSSEGSDTSSDGSPETVTYESENGPIEVPADPQRVAVLGTFAGNVMALDVPLIGVDSWAKLNPQWEDELSDVTEVTDESLEKLIELEPDLIIGLSNIKKGYRQQNAENVR